MLAALFSHFKLNRFPFNLLNLSLVKTVLCAVTAGELICRGFCSDNTPPSCALLCPNKWLDYISQICFLTRLPSDLLHAVCGGSDPAGGGRRLPTLLHRANQAASPNHFGLFELVLHSLLLFIISFDRNPIEDYNNGIMVHIYS